MSMGFSGLQTCQQWTPVTAPEGREQMWRGSACSVGTADAGREPRRARAATTFALHVGWRIRMRKLHLASAIRHPRSPRSYDRLV